MTKQLDSIIINRQNSLKYFIALVAVVLVAIVFYYYGWTMEVSALSSDKVQTIQSGSKLSDISPNNRSNLVYKGNDIERKSLWNDKPGDMSSGVGFKHILKSNQSSRVTKLSLRSYHASEEDAKNARYELRWNTGDSEDCKFSAKWKDYRQTISLKINGGNKSDQEFSVRADGSKGSDVCKFFNEKSYPKKDKTKIKGSRQLEGSDYWVNTVEFELSKPDNREWFNKNERNHIRFQVRVNNGMLGHEGTAEESDYGIVENYSSRYGIATGIRFAQSCEDKPNNPIGEIKIYDPDEPTFGPTYVNVYKSDRGTTAGSRDNWERLKKEDLSLKNGGFAEWSGNSGWKITAGNKKTVSIIINDYDFDTVYLMILDNPNEPKSTFGPTGNVIGYSLPGDPISAELSCVESDDYELIPGIEVTPNAASPKETVTVNGWVSNNRDIDAGSHGWRISRIEYGPDQVPYKDDFSNTTDDNVCNIAATKPHIDCEPNFRDYTSSNNTFSADSTRTNALENTYDIPDDAPLGTTYCFVASVEQPRAIDAGEWGHSSPDCVTVGIKPKLQVWGYDARVGGLINTSLSRADNKTYGSWAEYGLASDGDNIGMASGSGLSNGNNNMSQGEWSNLTFANKLTVGGPFGQFGSANLPPSTPINSEQTVGNGGFVRWSDINNPDECSGKRYTCVVDGTLLINNNISINNGIATSINDLQRVVIVADNIVIDENVTRVDAWLYAVGDSNGNGGYVSTCDAVNSGGGADSAAKYQVSMNTDDLLEADQCSKPLEFNGPVVANYLYPYRTSGANLKQPAERFNLRPDAFLSSLSGTGNGRPVATTEAITELPPRF